MKIPKKQELQQTAFNHSSNIDFQEFVNICKKMYCITIFFFWLLMLFLHQIILYVSEKNPVERIQKLSCIIMTIDDKTRDEKLQYDINRKAFR